jgi:3-hydroxyisobutyrate dehydrogenase-like beta-hydroxyacid dehydrogenase
MAPPPVKTVGYIGLGKAGSSMASNLPKAGFNLIVRDSDPVREQKFARENRNTRIAERNPDAFREADVIITMLPNGKIVREVLLGQGGFAPALRPGNLEHSSTVLANETHRGPCTNCTYDTLNIQALSSSTPSLPHPTIHAL